MNVVAKQRVVARENPFIVQRTDAIPFDFRDTPFDAIDDFAQHVSQFAFRGAIVGKHGRGKTTLLADLHRWLVQQSFDCELVYVARESELQTDLIAKLTRRGNEGAILLVDGLERLRFLTRNRLVWQSKSFGGFIATTHRTGRLKTLVRCRSSLATLQGILDSLGITDPGLRSKAISLWPRHQGNIRLVLRQLYDDVAEGV